ncbi:MAG TPA: efflux RND transporter periplasmic adaptor subunit [Phycisphaerae bacterium]|nr:efflux RND transporter periplasmic adaptor subunit [Phycisphaerae bacterium]
MKYLAFILIFPAALTMCVIAGCNRKTPVSSDEHGHGPPAHDAHGDGHAHGDAEGPEPVVVTLFTPKVELFMEYPQLVKGREAEFLAHFSVLATGEPVRSGSLTFEATSPDGKIVSQRLDAPKRDGLFVPTPTFDATGTYKLRLVINSPQVQETMDVGELQVHPDAAAAELAAAKSESPEPPNLVPFLMEQQWKIGMLLGQARERTLTRRLVIPGQVAAPQGASAIVSAPVSGRLLPPAGGRLPWIGDRVEAGQVLALVEPPLPATDLYQLNANRAQVQTLDMELALRELDLDMKALEVERSMIQSKARLEYTRRDMKRAKEIHAKGAGSQQQYDEAEQDFKLAEAEAAAAQAMQKACTTSRERLNRLRSETASGPADVPAAGSLQLPLRAPIAGQIVSVGRSEGEHIEAATDAVFRIVNTERVWIQAQIPEVDLPGLPDRPGASIAMASLPDRRIQVPGEAGSRLVHLGSVVDMETRSVPIIYELPNPQSLLRVGMFADVHLETRTAVNAVAVPEEAVVLDNGRPIAFVLVGGESFQRRDLEIGIRDNGYVEVISGIRDGERVATKGAYAVKLSSLSGASFGAGHGH